MYVGLSGYHADVCVSETTYSHVVRDQRATMLALTKLVIGRLVEMKTKIAKRWTNKTGREKERR